MVCIVRRCQHLTLIHIVYANALQDLALDKVSYSCFRHDGNGYSRLNFLDHSWVRHASDAPILANVCGNTLKGHDCAGACFLGDACLFGIHDIHDHAAFEHLRQASFDEEVILG